MRKILMLGTVMTLFLAGPAFGQQADEVQFFGNPNSFLSNMVIAGNTIYLSGVLAPSSAGPEVEDQTRAIMERIRDQLAEVGATMDDVVKCTVYMADLSERPRLNEVYRSFFPNNKPARSAVGVDLGGPRAEIECMAVLPDL